MFSTSPAPNPMSELQALQPHNVEAEQAILGGLLVDPNALQRVEKLLPSPDVFYIHTHRTVYEAILTASRPPLGQVDLLTVCSLLRDANSQEYENKLYEIGGQAAIARLLEQTISAVNIDQYAELIKEKWIRRKMIKAGLKIQQLAYAEGTPADDLINLCEAELSGISQLIRTSQVKHLAEAMGEVCSHVEAIQDGLVKPGVMSDFYDLDAMTNGFHAGDLFVLAGRPSMGKTVFAIACARNVAAKGVPVLLFSLEMSSKQLATRALATETKIDGGRIRMGKISDPEWDQIGKGLSRAGNLPIFIDDGFSPTVAEIKSKVAEVKAKNGGLGLVVIDYFQLLEGPGDRLQFLSRTVRQLKKMAMELEITVVLLSQLNRGVESRTNKRPMMSDLRETGAIEQDADVVAMLYREEYYDPDTPDRGIVEVILAKHRNGPTGTVKLLFDAQFGDFKNRSKRV